MDKRTSTNGNKVLGYIAKRIAVRDANTTCPFLGYQPKLPTAVKELKNFRRLRNAASRINTAFFCYKNKISPQGLW